MDWTNAVKLRDEKDLEVLFEILTFHYKALLEFFMKFGDKIPEGQQINTYINIDYVFSYQTDLSPEEMQELDTSENGGG